MPLIALPNELLIEISSYLHPLHHSALIRTNRRLYSTLSDALTKSLCQPSSEITDNGSSKWARKALYSALRLRDAKTVQKLVTQGVAKVVGKPMEVRDMSGSTGRTRALLSDAIVTLESTEAIKLLLECGVAADTKEFVSGWTPLFRAIQLEKPDMVRLFLNRKDVDVNSKDHLSFTPLHKAASCHGAEVIYALLEDPRVEVNEAFTSGRGPALHRPISSLNIGIMMALLERKDIDVNIPDYLGRTPLLYAICKGFDKGVEALLERPDVKLDSLAHNGMSVLHSAAITPSSADILRLLLAQEEGRLPPFNLRETEYGHTPLHDAVFFRSVDMTHCLLADSRFDANVLDHSGATPLYLAVERGFEDLVRALLESGKVDVNAFGSGIKSPIYRAAAKGRGVILKMLLDHPGSDLGKAIAGTDFEDPSACESTLPDISRNILMERLSRKEPRASES
ncbi:ankyrin [Choiromyces venosus 120613-1]|uniref:Ankyrin n=1 Tax=Choiromyces venosus 120613-1 TaxID=1336337 RepID=A0A3N4J7Z3_9PEZI|nr:ankyrin [Choiromyces venosus 120613-1]